MKIWVMILNYPEGIFCRAFGSKESMYDAIDTEIYEQAMSYEFEPVRDLDAQSQLEAWNEYQEHFANPRLIHFEETELE